MTKEQLKKSHDTMARFLVYLCRESDDQETAGIPRTSKAEKKYERARRLIRSAGFKYEPAHK